MPEQRQRSVAEARGRALPSFPVALLVLAASSVLGLYMIGALQRPSALFLIAVTSDLMIGSVIFLILRDIQRSNALALILSIAVPAGLLLASYTKLAHLGSAGSAQDVFLIQDLLAATPSYQWAMAWVLFGGLLLLFLGNLARRKPSFVHIGFLVVAIGVPILATRSEAVSRTAAFLMPGRITDFPVHGHFLSAWLESLEKASFQRMLAATDEQPGFDLVPATPGDLHLVRRNVYFIVLESFVDPMWFPRFRWPEEPLAPLFAAWRATSDARSVSPTFGARSTNVEFEMLCGIPAAVDGSTVVFLHLRAGQSLRCLPRILAEAGFQTLSVIAENPGFLNGSTARAAVGFARLVFAPDLDMADRDGMWLSAASTLDQAEGFRRELLDRAGGGPLFSYVFITAGHHPYERNEARRPDVLAPQPSDRVVTAWSNGAHYNAIAVDRHVEGILRADPEALIVILGDHGPVLGTNFAGYESGGRIARADTEPPLRQEPIYQTPLLIIDRGRILPLGRLPTWQLPEVVLNMLSEGEYCARMRCASTRDARLRPFYDFSMLIWQEIGDTTICGRLAVRAEADVGAVCDTAMRDARALQAILARQLAASE